MTKRRCTVIGITAAAVVGACTITAFAAGPADTAPLGAAEIGGQSSDSVTTWFEVDDESREIRDKDGKVVGTLDDAESAFQLTDDDGNPVSITISPVGEQGGHTVTYSVTEAVTDTAG